MRATSTDQQDLTAQRDGLQALGVQAERIYVDHGLTGTNRERPGLHQALAACRAGDTLVVTKLDRLARSLPDARAIADELTQREVKLNLGGSVHGGHLSNGVKVANNASSLTRVRGGWWSAGAFEDARDVEGQGAVGVDRFVLAGAEVGDRFVADGAPVARSACTASWR